LAMPPQRLLVHCIISIYRRRRNRFQQQQFQIQILTVSSIILEDKEAPEWGHLDGSIDLKFWGFYCHICIGASLRFLIPDKRAMGHGFVAQIP